MWPDYLPGDFSAFLILATKKEAPLLVVSTLSGRG